MTKRYLALLTWLVTGFSSPVFAGKVGPEFQVNTYTLGSQGNPAIAANAAGDFVVVWASGPGQDGDDDGVFGQRYDSSGSQRGSEFQVNTYTTGTQTYSSIASDANGNFVVVWRDGTFQDDGQDGSEEGVFGQRFDSKGNPLGGEFQVNTYTTGDQGGAGGPPSVASDANGNFVVVWADAWPADGQDGSGAGVFGQRFDSDGNPLGGEFQVNTYTTNDQRFPSVASDMSGNFVVVWTSDDQDGDRLGIFGQRYDSEGNRLGAEFQVSTFTTSYQNSPAVASAPDGNFVVVWSSFYLDGSGPGVFGQRYDSDGNPLGGEFQVNTYTKNNQGGPSVTQDASGNFVVVWVSVGQDGSFYGIFGQGFDSSGNRLGGEFQVNTYTRRDQGGPSIAANGAGDFVVVWESWHQDGDLPGVFGQRFSAGCGRRTSSWMRRSTCR